MFGVARLERFAFMADAVSEERVGADHPRDRIDLFLPDLVHGLPPGSCTEKRRFQSDASIAMGPAKPPRLSTLEPG